MDVMDVDLTASVPHPIQPCSLAVGLHNVSGQRARSSGSLTPALGRQVIQPQASPKYAPFVHVWRTRSHITPSGRGVCVSIAASSSPVAPTIICL